MSPINVPGGKALKAPAFVPTLPVTDADIPELLNAPEAVNNVKSDDTPRLGDWAPALSTNSTIKTTRMKLKKKLEMFLFLDFSTLLTSNIINTFYFEKNNSLITVLWGKYYLIR